MNAPWRAVAARSCIIATMLCGAWMLVVAPLRSDLARAEQRLARARAESARARSLAQQMQTYQTLLERSKAALERVSLHGAIARDPSRLFDVVSAIGAREGVTIHQIRPARSRAGSPDDPAGDDAISYDIDATGRYADVARFLSAVEREAGYAAIEGFSIRPITDQPGVVRAGIRTRHHAFATPSEAQLLAAVEAQHAGVQP